MVSWLKKNLKLLFLILSIICLVILIAISSNPGVIKSTYRGESYQYDFRDYICYMQRSDSTGLSIYRYYIISDAELAAYHRAGEKLVGLVRLEGSLGGSTATAEIIGFAKLKIGDEVYTSAKGITIWVLLLIATIVFAFLFSFLLLKEAKKKDKEEQDLLDSLKEIKAFKESGE